ncbi:MAG: xanthine dehydrogenase family protein molybdopterin-binding subunit [Acetobacteraceae bacterium]
MTPGTREREWQVIGRELAERPELRRFLTGDGRFVDDIDLPHMLHAAVLRSPYAHAEVRRLVTDEAARLPGVAAIFTARDLGPEPRKIPVRLNPYATLDPYLQVPLAGERLRYVGEPIALVVAVSRAIAEDALGLIGLEVAELPAVTDALGEPPATLFADCADNVACRFSDGFGDLEGALGAAEEIVSFRFRTGRHSAVPLETRGILAAFDRGHQRLDVFGFTKVPHFNRGVLAGMLGIPERNLHVVVPDAGGGFGVRGEFYPEDFLIPFAAMRLRRPVKWIEDRLEHLVAANHSREQHYAMQLGLTRAGRLLGIEVRIVNDMGAYIRTHGVIVPELAAGMFPGPYRFAAYRAEVSAVMTNKTPTGTYRGPGRFECNAARERLIDVAAARIGIAPDELRRRNFIAASDMPWRAGTHALGEEVVYDSGDYSAALADVLARSGYASRRAHGRSGRLCRGLGIGCFVEKTGKGPWEGARVALDRSGVIAVATGAASLGQGIETMLAKVAAEALGQKPAAILVRAGEMELLEFGTGSFASRGTVLAGNAAWQAARELARRLLELAAGGLGTAASELKLVAGAVEAADGRRVALSTLAAAADPLGPELAVTVYFPAPHMAYAYGAVIAEVEIDRALGRILPRTLWISYDVGTVISPEVVRAQIEGGAAQAIGGALLEEFLYDDAGQLQSGSLVDYLLPVADAMPAIEGRDLGLSPSPLNPLGVKGAGEAGLVGVGAALANAVADALGRPEAVDRLPMTPERVWRWAQAPTHAA